MRLLKTLCRVTRSQWRPGFLPCRLPHPNLPSLHASHRWIRAKAVYIVLNGLSPRLRGNQWREDYGGRTLGSIPAPAGEPCMAFTCHSIRRVYPRACGGTSLWQAGRVALRGLSPRLRGNLAQRRERNSYCRSIPAPAGEPWLPGLTMQRCSVYPRACGGTFMAMLDANPPSAKVYPRACGGTMRSELEL